MPSKLVFFFFKLGIFNFKNVPFFWFSCFVVLRKSTNGFRVSSPSPPVFMTGKEKTRGQRKDTQRL